jgi:integrase/recombinase XerD
MGNKSQKGCGNLEETCLIIDGLEPWARRSLDNMLDEQRSIALKFLEHLQDKRASLSTVHNYIKVIKSLALLGVPFCQLEQVNLRKWSRELDSKYALVTADLTRLCAKRFLRWVKNGSEDGEYPDCVSWIKIKNKRNSFGGEVISKQEIRQLIDATDNQRDRAILFVAYESGCRASELVGLRIQNIEFDQYGAIIRVNGKTGERRIRLFESVPDLQLWLSMHPFCENPDAPLWPSRKTRVRAISRRALDELVRKYVKRTGIKKTIYPHVFRHSRATHLATVLKEAQMREFFGWSKDSDMPSIYVHLSGRDIDETLFEHYGIKPKTSEKEQSPLEPKVCPRCKLENPPSAKFCQRCSACLDLMAALDLERMHEQADGLTAKVIERFIQQAPDLLKRILEEERVTKDIEKLKASEESGSSGL